MGVLHILTPALRLMTHFVMLRNVVAVHPRCLPNFKCFSVCIGFALFIYVVMWCNNKNCDAHFPTKEATQQTSM